MWSGYNNYVTVVKILLAAPVIYVNKKSNVSDLIRSWLDQKITSLFVAIGWLDSFDVFN